MSATTTRPARKDAARNHQLLLEAGRAVLGELGPEASMEQIASRAGVGVGTVYRHFPNKDALLQALVGLVTGELIATGYGAMQRTDGSGLEEFLRAIGRSFHEHRTYVSMLFESTQPNCEADLVRGQIATLTERAKAAGRLAAHVEFGDVMVIIWGMRGVVESAGVVAPNAWERLLDLHLIALRDPSARSAIPAVTADQLARIAGRTPNAR